MFDGSKRYIDPFFYEMNENLTKTYIEVDKFIYENVPIESIATLIERKTVYDRLFGRDVPSIFDPVS